MTLTPPVSLVVFDLDGVLCDFLPDRRSAHLAVLSGRDPAWIQANIWDADFEREAEAGAYLSGEAYLEAFNRRLGFDLTREQWVAARRLAMSLRPAMFALLEALRPRVQLALLTNNGALLRDTLPLLMPELSALLGENAHVSCDLGARKPQPLVYTRLVARYGQSPSTVLFVDDSPTNVEGARAAGLQALVFEGHTQLTGRLEELFGPLG
jgi:putative hydrolase of the HAD superfamily